MQMTEKKRLTISLSDDVYQKLVEDAKKAGLNKSAYITIQFKILKKEDKKSQLGEAGSGFISKVSITHG